MTEPIEEAALKPCPFCGATPHRGLGKVYYDQLHGEPQQNYSIWCPRGHAKITRVDCEQATEEWNTRASPAASGDLRERIARIVDPTAKFDTSIKWGRFEIQQRDLAYQKADAILASLPGRDEEVYLVWSNEHRAWWGPNHCGYNTHLSHAGRYTRDEALAICVGARGGREFNRNPSETPVLLKDAEIFWPDDDLQKQYRREDLEREEEDHE